MRTTVVRGLLVAMTALFAVIGSGASAWAQPAESPQGPWPIGMPDDLKPFFPGTPEFDGAEWSTNPQCADKGGDIGAYVFHSLRMEARLAYWSAPATNRVEQYQDLMGVSEDEATAAVKDGKEPTNWPNTFPAGDVNYSPTKGFCAADLKKWAVEETSNPWGFTWASKPDAGSIEVMKQQRWVDNLPDDIFENPCSDIESLCSHAFFLDCDKTTSRDDAASCLTWNKQVGVMFGGTWNWVDQNRGFLDKYLSFMGKNPLFSNGKWVLAMNLKAVQAIGEAIGGVGQWASFVTDPGGVIDDWANTIKDGAMSSTTKVLEGLSGLSDFNPADPGFLRWYAVSAGIGVFVFALTTLFVIYRTGKGVQTRGDMAKDLAGYAPAGLLAMMFAPAAAQLIVSLSHEITQVLAGLVNTDVETAVLDVSTVLGGITKDTLVGGVLAGLVMFFLLFIGAMSLFFGLLMHAVALPVLAGLCGIAFGLWGHPTLRKKALRPIFIFISIIFSKPLLFLALGFLATVISAASRGAYVSGDLASLGSLAMIAVAFVMIGLAPWTLLKWAPFMPTTEDSEGFGASGSESGQGVGNALQTAQMSMSRGGGGGGAGHEAAARAQSAGNGGGGLTGGGGSTSSPMSGKSSGAHAAGPSAPHGGGSGGGGKGGGAITKQLMNSAGKSGAAVAGTAATLGVGAAVVGASVAGSVMNKAATAAQNAPEQADMEGLS